MRPRTIPSPAILDKWDIAFIRHFKSANRLALNTVLALWGERCAVDADSFHLNHINEYLANLIDRLNLTPDLFTVLTYMRPDQAWKVGAEGTDSEQVRALYVMASWLRLTEVKYLPGYREAIEADTARG